MLRYESIKTEVFNSFYGFNAEPMLMAICCVARAEHIEELQDRNDFLCICATGGGGGFKKIGSMGPRTEGLPGVCRWPAQRELSEFNDKWPISSGIAMGDC